MRPGLGRSMRSAAKPRDRGARSGSGGRRAPRPPRARIPRSRAQARYMATIRGGELAGRPSTRSAASAGSPAASASSASPSRSSRWAARRTSAAGGRRALRMRFSSELGAAQAGLDPVAQLDARRAPRSGPRPPRTPARPSAPAAPPWSLPRPPRRASRRPSNAASSRSTPGAALARERAQRRLGRRGRGRLGRVRVHERDLQPVARPRARTGTGRRSG